MNVRKNLGPGEPAAGCLQAIGVESLYHVAMQASIARRKGFDQWLPKSMKSNSPLRVLCIDHEGGHGGASRSLFLVLEYMDKSGVVPEVLCGRHGIMETRYRGIGVSCSVEPDLPSRNSLPRAFDNYVEYPRHMMQVRRVRPTLKRIASLIDSRFDVVHFNYEGLWRVAHWLRPRVGAAFSMHIRTRPAETVFSRWQARTISRDMDRLIFICDDVRDHFADLGGTANGEVILNVPPLVADVKPHDGIPQDARLKVAVLGNFHINRGTDRLTDVAARLASWGERNILFVIAGDMKLSPHHPGRLGEIGGKGGSLADFAAEKGVAKYFHFLGHVSEPERVLAACDILARPARSKDSWSRDIIESLFLGRPAITICEGNGFAVDDRNALVRSDYNTDWFAQSLIQMRDDEILRKRLGAAGQEDIGRLCDGRARSADLARAWQDAISARRRSVAPNAESVASPI